MHGQVPPMSGGITILYSIAIRTHCPTLLTPPPLRWLDICLSKIWLLGQWNTAMLYSKHEYVIIISLYTVQCCHKTPQCVSSEP